MNGEDPHAFHSFTTHTRDSPSSPVHPSSMVNQHHEPLSHFSLQSSEESQNTHTPGLEPTQPSFSQPTPLSTSKAPSQYSVPLSSPTFTTHPSPTASFSPLSFSLPRPTPPSDTSLTDTLLLSAEELMTHVLSVLRHLPSKKIYSSPQHGPLVPANRDTASPSHHQPPVDSPFYDPQLQATTDRIIRVLVNEHHQRSVQHTPWTFSHSLTIFAASDPDAVCSVALLKEGLSERFGINLYVIPISCYTNLRHAVLLHLTNSNQAHTLHHSSCLFFINVGARQDVRTLLAPYVTLNWKPTLFIFDYHRPIDPCYFRSPQKFPCYVVCSSEELKQIKHEHHRYDMWCRRFTDPDPTLEEVPLNENDDLTDFHHLNLFGEYSSSPSALVLLEAFRSHCLETPPMVFLVATSFAYHLFNGHVSRVEYAKHLALLHEHFHQLRRQNSASDHLFKVLKPVKKELLIPLLRFTSIEDGLRHSALFLRAQTSRFATPDVVEQELSALRVLLALKQTCWEDQFRFLNTLRQKQLIHGLIPQVLTRVTLEARERILRRYPDDQETHFLTSTLAFVRLLSSVGLPDRISSLDLGFLLLAVLSRPSLPKHVQILPVEKHETWGNIHAGAHNTSFFSDQRSSEHTTSLPYPHCDTAFVEALDLLESVVYTSERHSLCVAGHGSTSCTTAAFSGGDSTPEPNKSTTFFGNIWDAYLITPTSGVQTIRASRPSTGNYHFHQRLARLSRIALQLLRDISHLVLRLMKKRRVSSDSFPQHRRAVGNIEGFLDDAVPQHLHHPLLLRYCACVTSDCIARGVMSASPGILLFVHAAASDVPCSIGVILGFVPNVTLRTPSKLGLHLYHTLRMLKKNGSIGAVRQDDYDASVAFVPPHKLQTAFSALFTQSHRSGSEQHVSPHSSSSDVSDPPSEHGRMESTASTSPCWTSEKSLGKDGVPKRRRLVLSCVNRPKESTARDPPSAVHNT